MQTFSHTRTTAFLAFLALSIFAPTAMAADNCVAPPGTSGIDQYCEALPSPGGNGGGSHHGSKGSGSGGYQLPAATKKALQSQGAAGASVLALTRSSGGAPPPQQQQQRHRTASAKGKSKRGSQHQTSAATPAPGGPQTVAAAPSSNPISAVGSSASVGAGFIAALLGIALVLGVLGWFGRRERPGAESA